MGLAVAVEERGGGVVGKVRASLPSAPRGAAGLGGPARTRRGARANLVEEVHMYSNNS